MATTVTSLTSAWAATRAASTASPAITITIATAAAGTSLTCTFRTRSSCFYRRNHSSIDTVEVRLVIRVELRAAFNHCRGCALRSAVD